MGVRNKQGGNKTKGMARGKSKRVVAEKLNCSTEMFGQITLISGPTFKIMCSDGHERTSKAPGYKKCGRLLKGSYVKIDTTDKHFCTILCLAKPNEDAINSLKKDSDNDKIIFTSNNDEFAKLIDFQNQGTITDDDNSNSDSDDEEEIIKNDYSNMIFIDEKDKDEYDDEYDDYEEEEVDKWGNTILKNKDSPKVIEEVKKEDEEIIINQKFSKINNDDENVSNKKSAKKQKHIIGANNNYSNSDNNSEPDLDFPDILCNQIQFTKIKK